MKKLIFGLLLIVSFYSNAQKDTLNLSTVNRNGIDTKALKAFGKQFVFLGEFDLILIVFDKLKKKKL